jgi:sorbose reductase
VDLNLDASCSAISDISAHVLRETGCDAGKMHGYACNTVKEEEVEATVTRIVQDFGQIDVLVTCAGICIHDETANTDLATWRKVLAVNLDGTYLFARHVGKHMLERQIAGSMILVASAAASHPPRPQVQASYNASKAGVKALAISLATEWAGQGIRVNSFSPGYMTTPLMPVTNLQKEWLKQIPMGASLSFRFTP